MSKYVLETKAAKSISAYVIMRGCAYIGKILVHHSESCTFCNVWIDGYASKGNYCLYGVASGGVYGKENVAIASAIKNITGKADEWDAENNCRKFTPASFGCGVTSKIDSAGPRALEDIFDCTILQAI